MNSKIEQLLKRWYELNKERDDDFIDFTKDLDNEFLIDEIIDVESQLMTELGLHYGH